MESIYTKLILYGSNNECARTDNVFFSISEICDGTVSLVTDGPTNQPTTLLLDLLWAAKKNGDASDFP